VGCTVATGRFGAKMLIRSTAEGPINVLVEE
jgi:D-Tyr-tRNAtyr deacylase